MQGQWNHDETYYRCRYPREYALANTVDHPRNVYLAERDALPRLDDRLAQAFAPTCLEATIDQLYEAQDDQPDTINDDDIDPLLPTATTSWHATGRLSPGSDHVVGNRG